MPALEEGKGIENKPDDKVKPVFTLIYNSEDGKYGILGTPGFLDDEIRAYGMVKVAGYLVREYFERKMKHDNSLKNRIVTFTNQNNFRGFLRGKR